MAVPETPNIHPAGAGTPTIRPSGGEGGPGMSSGSVRHLAAMYETHAQARATRDKLADAGIATGDMTILDRSAGPGETSFSHEPDEGLWGAIKRMFVPDEDAHAYAEGVQRGHAVLYVRPKAEQLEKTIDILEDSGSIDLEAREREWRSAGWSGTHAGQAPYEARMTPRAPDGAGDGARMHTGAATDGGMARGDEQVIPVAQEHLRVGKREVRAGCVRVRSYVVEEPADEQVQLREERVGVERRKVDRPTDAGDDAFRERNVEVTASREEPVVSKDARVVEEVAVRKDVEERTHKVDDTVRRTEVEVDDDRNQKLGGRSAGTAPAGPGSERPVPPKSPLDAPR